MCSAADRARLDSLLRRGKRLGYCADDVPTVADLFNTADDDFFFFQSVKTNYKSNQVLQPRLPDQIDIPYHDMPYDSIVFGDVKMLPKFVRHRPSETILDFGKLISQSHGIGKFAVAI